MKTYAKYLSLMSFAFCLFSLTSCSEGYYYDDDETEVLPEAFTIMVENSSEFGNILVNQNKQAMYFFAGDVTGQSNCTGECEAAWPPVIQKAAEIQIGTDMDRDDFDNITRTDGAQQLTYKGWPLYYFSPEGDLILEAPGEILGDAKGGVFHIAKPDYSILLAQQEIIAGEGPVLYLVDAYGVSLYLNTVDGQNSSNCSGGCADVWPPLEKKAVLIAPSSLDASDFDSFDRLDELGAQQSFKGSPLYYFIQDEDQQGRVSGQGGGPNQTFFVIEM